MRQYTNKKRDQQTNTARKLKYLIAYINTNNLNGCESKTNDNKQKQHSLKPSTTGSRGKGIDNNGTHMRTYKQKPTPAKPKSVFISRTILYMYVKHIYIT